MRVLIAVLLIGITPGLAQNRGVIVTQRVPAGMGYHRVWAVTPVVGTGKTPNDPIRPMFVQVQAQAAKSVGQAAVAPAPDRSGVLGYQMQLSDDRKFALVEFVFATPAAFQGLLQAEIATRGVALNTSVSRAPGAPGLAGASAAQVALEAAVPGLKIFERGKATDAQILAEFKKHKASFAFSAGAMRPQ